MAQSGLHERDHLVVFSFSVPISFFRHRGSASRDKHSRTREFYERPSFRDACEAGIDSLSENFFSILDCSSIYSRGSGRDVRLGAAKETTVKSQSLRWSDGHIFQPSHLA